MPFTTQGRMLQQKDKRLLEISLQCSVFYRLFLLPSTKKSQQTGNETAALPFFVWIFSLCLHDWQTWCFTFQTVTFPPQTVFKSHGGPARSNLSEVPISFWHIDVLRDLEEEVIPPALAPLFFLSILLSPNFMGSCGFWSRQKPSWRECSAQHWLETTAVRGAKESLGNLSWSRAGKAVRYCDTRDYK